MATNPRGQLSPQELVVPGSPTGIFDSADTLQPILHPFVTKLRLALHLPSPSHVVRDSDQPSSGFILPRTSTASTDLGDNNAEWAVRALAKPQPRPEKTVTLQLNSSLIMRRRLKVQESS